MHRIFTQYTRIPSRHVLRTGLLVMQLTEELQGLLHKRVLGKCHPSFENLLPWYSSRFQPARGHGHNKTLYGHNCEISHCQGLFSRSIFAMVDMYNTLPQHAVDCSTVSEFQSYLNHIAHTRCQQGDVKWSSSFCRRTWY